MVKVNEEIKSRIDLLAKGRTLLHQRAIAKAEAQAEYEKDLAITILKLRNGEIADEEIKEAFPELEQVTIGSLPATYLEKVARGIVWKQRLEMDKAEALYKVAVVGMQSLQAELNGYQSILKYQEEV